MVRAVGEWGFVSALPCPALLFSSSSPRASSKVPPGHCRYASAYYCTTTAAATAAGRVVVRYGDGSVHRPFSRRPLVFRLTRGAVSFLLLLSDVLCACQVGGRFIELLYSYESRHRRSLVACD